MYKLSGFWIAVFLFAAIVIAGCGKGGLIALLNGVYIQDGSADLVTGSYSTPFVYDWNSDGKKDLLVGQNNASNGFVSFYENLGTDSSPSFNGSTFIQACNSVCDPLNVTAGG